MVRSYKKKVKLWKLEWSYHWCKYQRDNWLWQDKKKKKKKSEKYGMSVGLLRNELKDYKKGKNKKNKIVKSRQLYT